MSASNESTRYCSNCKKQLCKIKGLKKTLLSINDIDFFSDSLQKTFNIGETICSSCRTKAYRRKSTIVAPTLTFNQQLSSDTSTNSEDEDVEFNFTHRGSVERIQLGLQRTVSTHRYCFICDSTSNGLQTVPKKARLQAYTIRKIYIPTENRCCSSHLINGQFYEDDLNSLVVYSTTAAVSVKEITELFGFLNTEKQLPLIEKIINKSISDEHFAVLTGFTWENIYIIQNELHSLQYKNHSDTMPAIVIFLIKLRTGNSNRLIGALLQLSRHQAVSEYVSNVIRSFEKDVLPFQLGVNAFSRQWLIDNHTTELAKKLFNVENVLILICDGTYVYHQKSNNNEYQRKSYSGQKKTHLCKPFTICTTDGFIIDMLGPFYGTENDASIMRKVIPSLKNLIRPGDIFVLDRGFRDVVDFLQSHGYRVMMPALKRNRKQLTTAEANDSRYVTKIRWVVEAVHGALKQKYKQLDETFDNKMLDKIQSLYRIAAYFFNRFGKPLISDCKMATPIFERMSIKKCDHNVLATIVEEKGLLRKKLPFQSISANDVLDFPQLTEYDMKLIFTGTYQYGQAISYLAEVLDDTGNLNMAYVKDHTNILKICIQSRHISKKQYRCFVKYNPDKSGIDGIENYCCECANGLRTVGCCSHIAAIIYYLSYGRYLSRIPRPNLKLSSLFKNESLNIAIESDSDDDA